MIMSMMDIEMMSVLGMIIVIIAILATAYNRNEPSRNKRLAKVPVRTREGRMRTPLPEDEPAEMPVEMMYVGFLFAAYIIAMFLYAF